MDIAARFIVIFRLSPIFVFPGIVLGVAAGWFGRLYIGAQLPVKRFVKVHIHQTNNFGLHTRAYREMSNARSPLFSHLSSALGGLVSIRAYGAQNDFILESLRRIDMYTRPARTFYLLNRCSILY